MTFRNDKKQVDALFATLLPPMAASSFDRAFRFMAVAEEELETSNVVRAKIDGVSLFWACRPSKLLAPVRVEAVYRQHVRSLIKRYLCDFDMRPATHMELACIMLETSKAAPLNSLGLGVLAFVGRESPLEEHIDPSWVDRCGETTVAAQVSSLSRKYAINDRLTPP